MRRLAALPLGLLFFLSGCGGPDPRGPFTDSRIPPGLEERFYPPEGWTWGLLQVGKAPPVRYGVSAPAGPTRGQVLILPDYGEPSETWFETARDLNHRGIIVWTLEAAGQSGSGRYLGRSRDLGYSTGFAPDVTAVQAMTKGVMRRRPLTIIASGAAAATALLAVEAGAAADVLVLESPRAGPPGDLATARLMNRIGLGALRPAGERWRRENPDDHELGLTGDAGRGRLRQAWQAANPDLRMGGPAYAWRVALADASTQARSGLARIRTKVLVTSPSPHAAEAKAFCRRLAACEARHIAGGPALHLERDKARDAWIEAVASVAGAPATAELPAARRRG
jgi:lysophospholipase